MLSRMPLSARRFLGGLLTLGLAVVIGLLLYWGGRKPPHADFRVIGISAYSHVGIPPNAFGEDHGESFKEKHAADFTRNNQTTDGIRSILSSFSEAPKDSTLIVLFSLHGIVALSDNDVPRALFLPQDTTPDSPYQAEDKSTSRVIEFREVLEAVEDTSTRNVNVLLLIDAGRLRPNWRLGHLSNDLATQLESEINDKKLKNLHVIVSTAAGETSWTKSPSPTSVFSFYVLEGLGGAADGCYKTESNVVERGKTDRRISCSELASYLELHVQKWARENRGVTQSVAWLRAGSATPDFYLLAVQSEEQPPQGAPTGEKSEEAAVTETADPSGKKTVETTGKATARIGTAPAPGPGPDPPVTSTNGTPGPSPSPSTQKFREDLNGLWDRRDKLRHLPEQRAPLSYPRSWRALQTHLIRSEQLLHCQADATDSLLAAKDGLKALEHLAPPLDDPEFSKAIRKLCEDAWRLDETPVDKPSEPAPTPTPADTEPKPPARNPMARLAEYLDEAKNPQTAGTARIELTKQLASLVKSSTQLGIQELRKCRRILQLIEKPALPPRFIPLKRLSDTAVDSRELGIRWDADFAELCRDAVVLRVDLESFATDNSDLLPRLEEDLGRALRHTTAAERWLEYGAREHARDALDHAGNARELLDRSKSRLRLAMRLRATLMAEIPDFAHWIANRMEDDPARCQPATTLSETAEKLAEDHDRFPSLDFNTLLEQQEIDLLKMIHGVRMLNRLLDDPSHDATALEDITDTCEKPYEAFRKAFLRDVEDLSELELDDVTTANWRQINLLLELPWVPGNSRRELLKRLRAVKSSTASRDAKPQQAELAGVWQAFWAIQTLSLAVLPSTTDTANPDDTADPDGAPVELESLWKQWADFVNTKETEQQEGRHAVMVARLGLGREIHRAWRRIADAQHDPSLNTTPARATQQALLARSLDGADVADLRLEDTPSIGQLSRARATRELPDLRNEWSRSQQAPAWLVQNWRPEKIDFALKKTSPSDSSHPIELSFPEDRLKGGTWKLAFECSSKIHTLLDGRPFTTPQSVTSTTLDKFRIKLDSDIGFSRKWVTIALLDESGFPVALDRILVIPPFDPKEWRIVFLANEDERREYLANLSSARNELVTLESGTSVAILRLPPSPEATAETGDATDSKDPKDKDAAATEAPAPSVHQLKPFLWRPKNDDSRSASIKVFRRINAGKPEQFLHSTFALARLDRLIPLVFETPAVDSPIDLSNGLIFELKLRRDADSKEFKKVDCLVQPDFWHPKRFLNVSDPEFEGLRLSLDLVRRRLEDPLLPGRLEVELCLPPELRAIASEESLLKAKVGGGRATLFAEFNKADLKLLRDRRSWTVSLTVAGFPRAFAWELEYGSPSPLESAPLRIIAPGDGPVFDISESERDKPGRLVIGINSRDLNHAIQRNPWKLDELWSLTYRFADDKGRLVPGLQKEIPLRYPVWKRFELQGLNKKTGFWTLRGQVGDHDTVSDGIPFPDRPGRYSLQAILKSRSDGDVVQAKDQMKIGVDTARDKPRVTDIVFESPFELDRDLSIKLTAQDPESGIRRVAVGFDENDDGKLSDEEVQNFGVERRIAGPAILATTRFELILPKSKVMKQGTGKKTLLVRATNGIKIGSDTSAKTVSLVRAKGYLIVEERSNTFERRTLTLTGPNRFSENLKIGRSASKAELKRNKRIPLSPGTYTLTDDLFKHAVEFTVDSRKEHVAIINYDNDPKPIRPIRPKSP